MDKGDLLEAFVRKWEPSILDSMTTVQAAVQNAGYFASDPESDVDLPDLLRWSMLTWQPGRPEGLESMDVFVAFTLVQQHEDSLAFIPFIEVFNIEGSYLNEIFISDALAIDDDDRWENVMNVLRVRDGQVVLMLQDYFPRPTKRIWKIYVTTPEGVKLHPSLHTNEEVAKQDASIRLIAIIDNIVSSYLDLGGGWMYSGWPPGSDHAIHQIRDSIDHGEIWKAFRKYEEFLDTLPPSLRSRVIKRVGSLSVERLGGYPEEEGY